MDEPWDVSVQSSHGVAGGAALLTCLAPSAVRSHVAVTGWFRDGVPVPPIVAEAGNVQRSKLTSRQRAEEQPNLQETCRGAN
ncbi:Uncharacterized protein OBRU01_17166 [Operophtera brumata]|uniref:Ig-like domain-containing protein n=1 Tax=Operophtera brumata TaxID=104452 RepID=A0A0L7L1D5_OPEBR|nr:Uncharacterized protein OBRU01_17166 [Operophtera brumata]